MWMPERSVRMKRLTFGFQRRVWCPKCTPLSSSWRMVTTAMMALFFLGTLAPAWFLSCVPHLLMRALVPWHIPLLDLRSVTEGDWRECVPLMWTREVTRRSGCVDQCTTGRLPRHAGAVRSHRRRRRSARPLASRRPSRHVHRRRRRLRVAGGRCRPAARADGRGRRSAARRRRRAGRGRSPRRTPSRARSSRRRPRTARAPRHRHPRAGRVGGAGARRRGRAFRRLRRGSPGAVDRARGRGAVELRTRRRRRSPPETTSAAGRSSACCSPGTARRRACTSARGSTGEYVNPLLFLGEVPRAVLLPVR